MTPLNTVCPWVIAYLPKGEKATASVKSPKKVGNRFMSFPVATSHSRRVLLFRFTIIWESMIVIIRENRAEVIEIIWERVEPRAA